jgi:HEAT repeat protein
MLGSATPAVIALTAVSATGCKDESQPEYWVDKLNEPTWRARAVARFEQFFEDALTRSNKNLKSPEVQELINKSVDALTKAYVEGGDQLDPKSRVALIKLLSGYRDKRADPAYKKAFEDFAKNPKTNKDDQDIKWAAIAVGDMKEEALAGPMLEAFLKLRANTMLGGVVYKDYNAAMLQMPNKAWAGPLITKLEAEVTRPGPAQKKDKDAIEDYMDQQFWQTTAAALLGKIKDPAAVEPLIKVILDPAKIDFQPTAMVALIEIGKPATDAAIKLLKGQDEKLGSYCLRRIKDTGGEVKGKPCVQSAAIILGSIGRADAVGPMVEVLKGENDDATKAVIARELPKLPASPESIAAFKTVYESLPLNAQIPPGQPALESLTEAAGQFFDPSLVEWLVKRADTIKAGADEKDEKQGLQQAITVTAIKLAKPDQLATVKRAANSYGTQLEKDLLVQAEALLKACEDRAPCYVDAITKRENQDRKTQFTGIKAAYMAAIYGNDQTRDAIVSRLENIDNAAVRYVSSLAIDRLSPKGSKTAVDKMGAIIDKNAKSPDRDKAMGDAPLKQVMYRLAARGG